MNKYELEDRTLNFSSNLISKLKYFPRNCFTNKLIDQVFRSGTSIGANYVEANGAESRKDFIHKIRIAYKEARETRYWLALLKKFEPEKENYLNGLWKESDEFVRIFSKIITTARKLDGSK